MDSQILPADTQVNALAAETMLNEKIDAAIAEGISADQISTFLAELDMAADSELVQQMRDKLLAARG